MMQQPEWKTAIEFEDITYKKANGVARIAFKQARSAQRISAANHLRTFKSIS